ncbi:MAG: hypothetical protein WC505_01460 [Patescibacteria group bacterium]
METEHPHALPEHIQKMANTMQEQANERIDGIIERHGRSSERYVDAVRALERASAGDSEVLTRLQIALDAEASGDRYQDEQRIGDAARFIADRFGNPYDGGKTVSREELSELCAQAFDVLVKEEYGYFENR